eukprot:14672299-Alexandrium_andersonii.AAC.1
MAPPPSRSPRGAGRGRVHVRRVRQTLCHTEGLDHASGHHAWQSIIGCSTGRRAVVPLVHARASHPEAAHSPHQ